MNYEAKFSAIGKAKGMAFLAIILCWLIIPLIIWICYCISVSSESVTISADKIVWRKRGLRQNSPRFLRGFL